MKGYPNDVSQLRYTIPRTFLFISIICASLTLGLTLTHVLEMPGKQHLSGSEWLAVQHTFYGGFAIVGAVSEITGLIASAASLWFVRRNRADFMLVFSGMLSFLGTLLSYWFGNRPINSKIAAWTTSTLPSNWMLYRDDWNYAHATSTVFAAVALTVLLTCVFRNVTRQNQPMA